VGLVIAGTMCWAGSASALPTKAQVCEAAKVTASGTKQKCLATELAKKVKGLAFNYAKCDTAFTNAFENAETKAGGACPTDNDASAIGALIASCRDDLEAALSGSPNPPCPPSAFPATGQTTCWNGAGTVVPCGGTGEDGEFQAGATLSYTDLGDGTIKDNNTGLIWEKKSDDGSIHDKDTTYTFANAFAVHIAGLNTANFAGHNDWRLPNVKELESILNYENANPSVSTEFNAACVPGCTVLNCSCTGFSGLYTWSSTNQAANGTGAWGVGFAVGDTNNLLKTSAFFARAVRGGL